MTIIDLNSSALMFLGVNEGYGGDEVGVKEPHWAALIAKEIISTAQRLLRDSNEYECHAGIAIYPEKWGCMIGGEPVAAIVTNGSAEKAIKMARHLQARFKQEDLTLAMFDEGELGKPTLNFHALLASSLQEFGAVWQRIAGEYFENTGIYVSVGAYEVENGIVISAQANHDFEVVFDDWANAAKAVCAAVSAEIGKEIRPEFSQVRYVYLNAQDLSRSVATTQDR